MVLTINGMDSARLVGGEVRSDASADIESGAAASTRSKMEAVVSTHPTLLSKAISYDKLNVQTPRQLHYADSSENRRGITSFMDVDEDVISVLRLQHLDGVRQEVAAFVASGAEGAEQVAECLEYILDEEAGSSPLLFPNSLHARDCGPMGVLPERQVHDSNGQLRGMRLVDFCANERVRASGILVEHVAALRLYTTVAFKNINDPLRDMDRHERGEAHPLPLIVTLIADAAKKLGAAEAKSPNAMQPMDLYRGMKNVVLPENILREGGVEIAPMSTTSELKVAMEYSLSTSSVLLRIETEDYIKRGVGVRWLSTFPSEEEVLYPPLTRLKAKGELDHFETAEGQKWTIVTVEPTLCT